MGINVRDDTVVTSAMPAGSWVIGGQTAADAAPTAFGRESILNYISSALAAVASSGSASDLSTGTVPNGRLHAYLADISSIQAPSVGDVIYYNGTDFIAGAITGVTVDGLVAANNLSDVANAATALTNLGATAAGSFMVTAANAAAQTALLSTVVGDSGAGGTKGLVPAPTAGEAERLEFLSADGTFKPAQGYGGYGPRISKKGPILAPDTWWVELEAFCQPGIITRETAGGQASFTKAYLREKIRAMYGIGARRIILMGLCVNGRTYTDWGITTPVDPNGATFGWWRDAVAAPVLPYVEDFDVLAEIFNTCDSLDGMTVVVGLGRHDDTNLLNDIKTVEFDVGVDPNTFGKTVATRKSEEIARWTAESADIHSRFGNRRSYGAYYCDHESDHLQSSASLYTSICTVLRVYGEVHVSCASPLDFADSDTIADAINSYKADWLWFQTSTGYGYDWASGRDTYNANVSLSGTGILTHAQTARALYERCAGRSAGGFAPFFGVDIELWRKGIPGVGTLTFGATSGSGVTVTLGTSDAITATHIGMDLILAADQATGVARIVSVTGNPVTSVTVNITEALADVNIASGLYAIRPDDSGGVVNSYPALASEVIYELLVCAPHFHGTSFYGEAYWDDASLSLVMRQAQGGSGASDYRTRAVAGWTSFEIALTDANAAAQFLAWNARSLADPTADRLMFWDESSDRFEWLTPSANLTITNTTIDVSPAQTGTTSVNTGPLAGLRNRLLNGAMRVKQRAAATNADDTYAHDRWNILTQTGTVAVSSVTDIENTWPYAMRITQSQASAQRFGFEQIIEAFNCKDLRGQVVTLSARVRMSASTTLRYAILEWTGTSDSVTSDVVLDWTSATFTANNFFLASDLTITATGSTALTANTAATVSLSTTLGSSTNNVIVLFWTDSTQAQNVTLDAGKIQLEVGASATAFEYIPQTLDIEMCRRYYQQVSRGSHGDAEDTNIIIMGTQFVPPMRVAPTLTLIDNTPTFNNAGGFSVAGTASTIASSGISNRGAYFRIDGFGGTLVGTYPYFLSQDDAISADSEM